MPTTKEEAEQEYMRARMAGASLSDEGEGPSNAAAESSTTSDSVAGSEPPLDDSISESRATELKEEGNALYKSGDYKASLEKYTLAATSAHASDDARAISLANRAAANLKLQRFRETADDATTALKLRPGYVKALKRRKEARVALAEWRGAMEDSKELKESPTEIERLRRIADQKEAKDKEEAIESLKGLGNSILSNFGMSLDDINMEKDPNTGSYSINLKR